MAKIELTGGAYQARSLIASAQRSVNLFPEAMPREEGEPERFTNYPTPGLRLLGTAPNGQGWRALYTAKSGHLFGVADRSFYYIPPSWIPQALGVVEHGTTPVSMADDGTHVVVVDGKPNFGLLVNVTTTPIAVGVITDPGFLGGDRVDYLDGFFIVNRTGTRQFYISGANATTWDPLDFASKVGDGDTLVAPVVVHRDLWLIGTRTTELWTNVGDPTFPFQIQPGVFIQHGCAARGSIAQYDLSIFWLSQEEQGQGIILEGSGYEAKRISTHAIEEAIRKAPALSDAIGWTYQMGGHAFYALTIPSLDRTFVFDMVTRLWHERAWADTNGALHRHRANCAAFAYGTTVVGDWQGGNLYALDLDTFTDNGAPIPRIRSFPHLVADGRRATHRQFIADMEVGTLGGTTPATRPTVSLRWSDDRGASWGNPIQQSLGAAGEYRTSVQFNRLGMARDRVYELSWTLNAKTALQGAWIDTAKLGS